MFKGLLVLGVFLIALSVQAQQANIALNKPVTASSAAAGSPASRMVDGKISRNSRWQAANGNAPHVIELDLQKYFTIREIRIHSGIKDEEKKPDEMSQAAGFWSIKNFRIQYWDDANWSDFPKTEVLENRLVAAIFHFEAPVSTSRIRIVCDDGEPINIMEVEVFGIETPGMPAPPSFAVTQVQKSSATDTLSATISVSKKRIGQSMKYVGYNQGYFLPGTNIPEWIEYSQVNSFRVWTSLNAFVPATTVQQDETLKSVEAFDQRKAELRRSPENNRFINWNKLLPLYSKMDSSSTNAMVFNHALAELKRLNVDVILQVGNTDFHDNWSNKWKQWQRYYAIAYYAAREGNVSMFAMQNEPNHRHSGPMKVDQWIIGMQIVSDAIHCAVEDVNRKYKRTLKGRFVGPVTAGQNTDWWTAVTKAVRTDYHGEKIDKDLIDIFSTHSYNSPAVGYATRIDNIRKLIQENHPAGKTIPIVFTEIGRWMNAYLIDKEETMDSPSLFTEWAGIYSNNMKNQGYGMWAFKFANTTSSTYPRGIKSGHHYIWQGKRIVEDAYTNLAQGKAVSSSKSFSPPSLVTDGDKTDESTWISDSTSEEKWIEIDLGKSQFIGSAVIYTGDASGVYTSVDRVRNFSIQYFSGTEWKNIPELVEKNSNYAQLFTVLKTPVQARKLRFYSTDKGSLKVREIKLFAPGDGPSEQSDFNVSGIQRTGQVVRLFAKGFREQRPLMETTSSVKDVNLDTYTSYDSTADTYYMWLVQRGISDYNLTIDFSKLGIPNGALVTAEEVSNRLYGEVVTKTTIDAQSKLNFRLKGQSVVLLTISASQLSETVIRPSGDATVHGGKSATQNAGLGNKLSVKLDASTPDSNMLSYIQFTIPGNRSTAGRILLKVHGKTNKRDEPYRIHVYGIPNANWKQSQINWNNAPMLNKKEALIRGKNGSLFIAGELAFGSEAEDHLLDITSIVNKHKSKDFTFVLVRETRQLGDVEDKGYHVAIESMETVNGPELLIYK